MSGRKNKRKPSGFEGVCSVCECVCIWGGVCVRLCARARSRWSWTLCVIGPAKKRSWGTSSENNVSHTHWYSRTHQPFPETMLNLYTHTLKDVLFSLSYCFYITIDVHPHSNLRLVMFWNIAKWFFPHLVLMLFKYLQKYKAPLFWCVIRRAQELKWEMYKRFCGFTRCYAHLFCLHVNNPCRNCSSIYLLSKTCLYDAKHLLMDRNDL